MLSFYLRLHKFTNEGIEKLKVKCDKFIATLKQQEASAGQLSRVFGPAVDDDYIDDMSKKQFAKSTHYNINWILKMYHQWREHHNSLPTLRNIDVDLEDISTINVVKDLQFALSMFICEARKVEGGKLPPFTICHIILAVQMHLHNNGIMWRLLEDVEFQSLRMVVDNKMKANAALGLGSVVKQVDVLDGVDKKSYGPVVYLVKVI